MASVKDCRLPKDFKQLLRDNENADYPVYLDFEDILTSIEGMAPYKTLMKVALTERVNGLIEKTDLASFLVLHHLRSHAIMNAMIHWHEEIGSTKFEHFVTLKWMLSDTDFLFRLTCPLALGHWDLFTSADHALPLCDSPILISHNSTMVALSPKLLLEIQPSNKDADESLIRSQRISAEKLDEYRRRTIGNTFREIIGGHEILGAWQKSREFRERVTLMKDVKNYNAMIRADGERELWQLNAYGNSTR